MFEKRIKSWFNRGEIEAEWLLWFVITVITLAVILVGVWIFKGKGTGFIDYLKYLLRFGR